MNRDSLELQAAEILLTDRGMWGNCETRRNLLKRTKSERLSLLYDLAEVLSR